MSNKELIEKKFKDLIAEGRQILQVNGYEGRGRFNTFPSEEDYLRFRTEAANLVRRVCGDDSEHYLELRRQVGKFGPSSNLLPHCLAVVEAARKDFEGGFLFDLRNLVRAELIGDFIDQAEALLNEGYYAPAASLAGGVLEDTLRKLCESKSIPMPAKTKIDSLNAELAKAGVYDKLIQKRIIALADIRNNADHGHFLKFKAEDVEDMVKWLRRFTADYLH